MVWVKIPKLCHNIPLSIFSLGKGRESLHLKPYIQANYKCASDLPPARNDLDKASMTHLKIARKCIFFRKFHTFPITEGNEIWHIYFQFTTPARKLTHNTKFEHFLDAERHEFQEHHNSSSPWARESPKSNPEKHEFWECHNSSLPWARESPKSNPERHKF